MATPYIYNINPAIAPGQSKTNVKKYGAIPGQIDMPSPYGDMSNLYQNLSGTNSQIAQNIASQLRGELSPETQSNIANTAAQFGVSSGMPGSGLSRNKGLRDLGLTSEAVKDQGLKNYNAFTTGLKQNQTVAPETQLDLAERNATIAAAPSPEEAFLRMLALYRAGASTGPGASRAPTTYSPGAPNLAGMMNDNANRFSTGLGSPNSFGPWGVTTPAPSWSYGTRVDPAPSPSFWSTSPGGWNQSNYDGSEQQTWDDISGFYGTDSSYFGDTNANWADTDWFD